MSRKSIHAWHKPVTMIPYMKASVHNSQAHNILVSFATSIKPVSNEQAIIKQWHAKSKLEIRSTAGMVH